MRVFWLPRAVGAARRASGRASGKATRLVRMYVERQVMETANYTLSWWVRYMRACNFFALNDARGAQDAMFTAKLVEANDRNWSGEQ